MALKLHLGCGKRYLPGWTHIDLADFPHIDYKQNAADLSNFKDGSVDEIYACNLLEHFNRFEVPRVLAEWARVLRCRPQISESQNFPAMGGILRLSVPDFEASVAHYLEHHDLAVLESNFIGGQKDKYDFHYYQFDFSLLEKLLNNFGFSNVQRYDWRDFLPDGFDDYSRCYLPHMDFEHGRLMVLNITAEKVRSVVDYDSSITLGMRSRGLIRD